MVVKLRENEILANEVDFDKDQVLEIAVNQLSNKTRFLRILPEDEAIDILQLFIEHDDDKEFTDLCKKVLKALID